MYYLLPFSLLHLTPRQPAFCSTRRAEQSRPQMHRHATGFNTTWVGSNRNHQDATGFGISSMGFGYVFWVIATCISIDWLTYSFSPFMFESGHLLVVVPGAGWWKTDQRPKRGGRPDASEIPGDLPRPQKLMSMSPWIKKEWFSCSNY